MSTRYTVDRASFWIEEASTTERVFENSGLNLTQTDPHARQ